MTTSTISLEQHQKEVSKLEGEISYLKEQLAWFQRQIFGPRSEKFIGPNEDLFLYFPGLEKMPPQPKEKKVIPAHDRAKPNRDGKDKITLPEDLPVERHFIDLSEEEKICQETGTPLVKIGEEITSKLAHKPGSYFIKQIVRPKYAHPIKSEEGVRAAPLPESLLNRCQADESFLADVIVKKFAE